MLRVVAAILAVILSLSGANAQSGYGIQAGDTLRIEVLEDPSLNRSALVLPDGSINFPLAGRIPVRGRTAEQVSASLTAGLTENFASAPTVFVSVETTAPVTPRRQTTPRTNEIFVTGEIENPGKIEASPGTTLLQAIAQAGGLTRFAAAKRIQLRRADRIYLYNFLSEGAGGSLPGSTVLAPGDVIVIPQRRLFE